MGKSSSVDESLFGNPKPGANSSSKGAKVETVSKVPASKANAGSHATVVNASDLQRMKGPSFILSPEEVRAIKAENVAKLDAERKFANEKKAAMVEAEEER